MDTVRNAAGDIVGLPSPKHTGGAHSPSSHRFKLFFPQVAPSTSDTNHHHYASPPPLVSPRSSASQRHQLTHVVVPFRLHLGDITLQALADEAQQRISKRYPHLTETCVIDSVEVLPLLWEDKGTGDTNTSAGAGGWVHDANTAFRLDVSMNGSDELDLYFTYPPTPFTGAVPPPFEAVLSWKAKPNSRLRTPTEVLAGTGGLSLMSPVPSISSAAPSLPPMPTRSQLPPLVPTAAPGAQQGPARCTTPLQSSSKKKSSAGASEPRSSSAQRYPNRGHSVSPSRKPSDPADSGTENASSSRLPALDDVCLTGTPQKEPDTPGANSLRMSASRGGTRRSLTTFVDSQQVAVAAEHDTGGSALSPPANNIVLSSPTVPASAAVRDMASETTSPYCETDSEANPEEFLIFQCSLIEMTEAEDRDTVVMQEGMERTLLVRQEQLAYSTFVRRPAGTYRPADGDSADAHTSGFGFSDGGGVVSPPFVQRTQQPKTSPRNATGGSSPAAPLEPRPPAPMGDLDAVAPAPRRRMEHSHDQAPEAFQPQVVARSSVEAAQLFAAAPTSRAALDLLRSQPEASDGVVGATGDHDGPAPRLSSSDDDTLACDELIDEWFALRHQVLTEERKAFRALTQEYRNVQRAQTVSMTQLLRDEALLDAIKFGERSPVKVHHSMMPAAFQGIEAGESNLRPQSAENMRREALEIGKPSPTPPLEERVTRDASTASAASSPSAHAAALTPRQPEVAQPATQRPVAKPLNDALLRLLKIVDVTEQSDRREISDLEAREFSALVESCIIAKKRLQLRKEQELINAERETRDEEQRLRHEIAQVEDRKFTMFVGLCAKGVQRIRAAETFRF